MGLFRSIIASAARNVIQLFFLITLTLIAVASMMSFLTVANTLEAESTSISKSSRSADFSINLKNLDLKTNDDNKILRDYLVLNPLKLDPYVVNKDKWIANVKSPKEIILTPTDKGTTNISRTLIYNNPNIPEEGVEVFSTYTAQEIKDSEFLLDEATQANSLTLSDAAALKQGLIGRKVVARSEYFIDQISVMANKYEFNFSYMASGVYTWSRDNEGGYVRLFPSIQNTNKPYNLNLLSGVYPGYYIDQKYLDAATLKSSSNTKDICLSIENNGTRIKCLGDVNKQVVLNGSFAKSNGIEIGDSITISSLLVRVVGIGQSKGVEFPSVVDLYPVPSSKITGIAWGVDNNESDSLNTFSTPNGQTPIVDFFPEINALFPEKIIYGRFIDEAQSSDISLQKKVNIRKEIIELVSREPDEEFIHLSSEEGFANVTRVVTLSTLVDTFRTITYALLGVILFVMLALSLLSTKSLVQQARARLAVMKAMGYSKSIIITSYSILPSFVSILATVGGYYLGLTLANILLDFLNPMFLNSLTLVELSPTIIAIVVLIPLFILVLSSAIMTYFLIKEPPAESLKIQDNKKPSLLYKFVRSLKIGRRKKSRIQGEIFLSNLPKIFSLSILMIISTSIIFFFLAGSQLFADYANNYKEGKNYTSAVYYSQPVWNSPLTRYSIQHEDEDPLLYNIVNIERLEDATKADNAIISVTPILNELFQFSFLKDISLTLGELNKIENINFPTVNALGFEFSYTYVKDLICEASLGDKYHLFDKDKYTIGGCIQLLFNESVPNFLKEKIVNNPNYPISFGRIYVDVLEEDLFTWADASISKGALPSPLLVNQEKKKDSDSIPAKVIGLDDFQETVELLDINGKDLFNDLRTATTKAENENYIPVVVNRSTAGKLGLKTGDVFSSNVERKSLMDIENNVEVYGVVKDEAGNILKTSGEMRNQEIDYPDGRIYDYYFPEKAAGLEEVTLAQNKGLLGPGWISPEKTADRFRSLQLDVVKQKIPIEFRVVGVTNNLDLDSNVIYSTRERVNKILKYENDWFSGKFTNKITTPNDVFNKQACLTNNLGVFTQDLILDTSFGNPVATCFTNIEMVDISFETMKTIEKLILPFVYIFLSLFVLLTIIIVYIVNRVTFQSVKKSIVIMRSIGYRSRLLFKKLAWSFWPFAFISIALTLVSFYLLSEFVLTQFLIDSLIELPVTLRWWYYVASGGTILLLFIVLFLVSFYRLRKSLISSDKKK